ncbi:hypothetical protein [Microseira sp. BLCC-F43]|jgi:hypothetical protein|uniref:hypothetical protein n=1 Tax=Microseira sp. BLCC-F43 TaxID=3153602 RepID=UPI00268C9248
MNKRGRPKSGKNRKTVGLSVEPEAWDMFESLAKSFNMTRSELVEAMARGDVQVEALTQRQALGKFLTI